MELVQTFIEENGPWTPERVRQLLDCLQYNAKESPIYQRAVAVVRTLDEQQRELLAICLHATEFYQGQFLRAPSSGRRPYRVWDTESLNMCTRGLLTAVVLELHAADRLKLH